MILLQAAGLEMLYGAKRLGGRVVRLSQAVKIPVNRMCESRLPVVDNDNDEASGTMKTAQFVKP